MGYSKLKTYQFYISLIGSSEVTRRAIHLRKWHGPICDRQYQLIMCYDKATLFKLLCYYRDAKVNIYRKKQTGVNTFEILLVDEYSLNESIETLYRELNRFKVEYKEPTSIEEVINLCKGFKPRYGKGTGEGTANCTRCGRCICNLIRYESKVVGHLYTTCECGDDIDFSEAHLYI